MSLTYLLIFPLSSFESAVTKDKLRLLNFQLNTAGNIFVFA